MGVDKPVDTVGNGHLRSSSPTETVIFQRKYKTWWNLRFTLKHFHFARLARTMFHMKHRIGELGESIAAEHLISLGFEVLERNYFQPCGEIDIVCRKGRTLHIVEVKATVFSSSEELHRAVSYETYHINERIDYEKMRSLRNVIGIYRSERKFHGKHVIDALFVYLVPHETYAAVEMLEDLEGELTKGDDWDFE